MSARAKKDASAPPDVAAIAERLFAAIKHWNNPDHTACLDDDDLRCSAGFVGPSCTDRLSSSAREAVDVLRVRSRERLVLDAVAALHPRLAAFIAEKLACEVCMNPKHDAHQPGVVWCYHEDPLTYFVPSDKVEVLAESLRASDEQNERYRSALERIMENADEVLNPTDGD